LAIINHCPGVKPGWEGSQKGGEARRPHLYNNLAEGPRMKLGCNPRRFRTHRRSSGVFYLKGQDRGVEISLCEK